MATTRGGSQNSVTKLIGSPKDLPVTDLATNRCVLQQMLQLRQDDPRDIRNIPVHELSIKTADLLIETWKLVNMKIAEMLMLN